MRCSPAFHAPGCRLAPEGEKAIEGQKYQPTGAKASNKEGKQPIGPTRGKYVRLPCPPHDSVNHAFHTLCRFVAAD